MVFQTNGHAFIIKWPWLLFIRVRALCHSLYQALAQWPHLISLVAPCGLCVITGLLLQLRKLGGAEARWGVPSCQSHLFGSLLWSFFPLAWNDTETGLGRALVEGSSMLFWFYYGVLKINDQSSIFEELLMLCERWQGETPGSYSNSSLETLPPPFLFLFWA